MGKSEAAIDAGRQVLIPQGMRAERHALVFGRGS
jgi:hypothetical protein